MKFSQSTHPLMYLRLNVHQEDWLTYSWGNDRTGEVCYNFSISDDLTPIINLLTWTSDSDSHSPALLDFFLFANPSICSTVAFPPLGNSDHVVVSVSVDFPSNLEKETPLFIVQLMTILVQIGMVFAIIWEMFLGLIYFNLVLLWLLLNFVSGSRL